MERTTFGLLFYIRRNKLNKSGEEPIFMRITARIAQVKSWLNDDPFKEIRFHKEKVERDFLEHHELKKLLDKRIEIPRLAQIRDVSCFCCLSGLAFSDVKQLRPEHIV